MRRAEWRVRVDDPKTLIGWWWQGVANHRIFRDRSVLLYAGLPFGVCLLIGLVGGEWGWAILALANLGFAASRKSKGSPELRAILPEPAPTLRLIAQVAYCHQGTITRQDEMALTVVDGWLVGEGLRSEFALRPCDIDLLRDLAKNGVTLRLQDGSEVVLLDGDRGEWHALAQWRGRPSPEGESHFPPSSVHPNTLAKAWRVLAGGICLALLGICWPGLRPDTWAWDITHLGMWYAGWALLFKGLYLLWRLGAIDRSARRGSLSF
ncbi:hypothetical protein EON82_01005 [bacterium]|nr:MAG: hypothetical protein EON82_01005 [bacterium]